jgi:hypothetical protein
MRPTPVQRPTLPAGWARSCSDVASGARCIGPLSSPTHTKLPLYTSTRRALTARTLAPTATLCARAVVMSAPSLLVEQQWWPRVFAPSARYWPPEQAMRALHRPQRAHAVGDAGGEISLVLGRSAVTEALAAGPTFRRAGVSRVRPHNVARTTSAERPTPWLARDPRSPLRHLQCWPESASGHRQPWELWRLELACVMDTPRYWTLRRWIPPKLLPSPVVKSNQAVEAAKRRFRSGIVLP